MQGVAKKSSRVNGSPRWALAGLTCLAGQYLYLAEPMPGFRCLALVVFKF